MGSVSPTCDSAGTVASALGRRIATYILTRSSVHCGHDPVEQTEVEVLVEVKNGLR
jgi:hypothetical protein